MSEQILKSILDSVNESSEKLDRIENRLIENEILTKKNTEEIQYLNRVVWQGNGKPGLTQQFTEFKEKIESTTNAVVSLDCVTREELARLNARIESRGAVMWSLAAALIGGMIGIAMGR